MPNSSKPLALKARGPTFFIPCSLLMPLFVPYSIHTNTISIRKHSVFYFHNYWAVFFPFRLYLNREYIVIIAFGIARIKQYSFSSVGGISNSIFIW